MAKLYFRYGAMGSSKTANAIMVQYNYEERGQKVLMLKPKLENRDGAVIVRSRCGLETACRFIEDVTAADAQGYGCVIIDEAPAKLPPRRMRCVYHTRTVQHVQQRADAGAGAAGGLRCGRAQKRRSRQRGESLCRAAPQSAQRRKRRHSGRRMPRFAARFFPAAAAKVKPLSDGLQSA